MAAKPLPRERQLRWQRKAARRQHRLLRRDGRYGAYLLRKHRPHRRGGQAPELRGLPAKVDPGKVLGVGLRREPNRRAA